MSSFRFSVGPWNVHEGADSYGPATRKTIPLEEKLKRFAEIGFSAVQFHDDDAVPNINDYTEDEIKEKARELKKTLDKYNLKAEFVAPRLWMDPHTADGGFMSTSKEDREYAMWRAYRSIDIANELGTDLVVLWLAGRARSAPRANLPCGRPRCSSRPSTGCWSTTPRSASVSSPSPTSPSTGVSAAPWAT